MFTKRQKKQQKRINMQFHRGSDDIFKGSNIYIITIEKNKVFVLQANVNWMLGEIHTRFIQKRKRQRYMQKCKFKSG